MSAITIPVTTRDRFALLTGISMLVSYAVYMAVTRAEPEFLTGWAWILCALTFVGIGVVNIDKSTFLASLVSVAVMRTVGLQIVVAIGSFVLVYTRADIIRDNIIDYSVTLVLLGNFVAHILPLFLLFVCLVGWPQRWRQTLLAAERRSSKRALWIGAAAVNCAVLVANYTFIDLSRVYGTSSDTVVYLIPILCIASVSQTLVFIV